MTMTRHQGLIHLNSPHPVEETIDALEALVRSHGLTVAARIDHSRDAARVGLKMKPTQLLMFGNPKAGTPLMIVSPLVAIDLPLKALAWEDADNQVWLSYNSPHYLQERYDLPEDLISKIKVIVALCREAVR